MTNIKVSGFKIFRDKKPPFLLRCYHRKTGHKIDLIAAPLGSAEFFAECEKIRALFQGQKAQAPKIGTLGGLVASYYSEAHFTNLGARTRKDYRQCLAFIEPIGSTPVHRINTTLVAGIHDKAATKIGWKRANMLRTVLSEVFRFAVPKGLISQNFATAVIPKPRPKDLPAANRPWTGHEIDTVLANAPPYIGAVLALMANTGLDPSDALHLQRSAIQDGVIWARRAKTDTEVPLPITPKVQAALDAAPRHNALTILANSNGLPWTYNGFSTMWHRLKADLVAKDLIQGDLTLKGLRHTVATVLREAGVSPREIADLLGQKTESMALHYSKNARLAKSNRATLEALDLENEKRTQVVKPFAKTVKPQ